LRRALLLGIRWPVLRRALLLLYALLLFALLLRACLGRRTRLLGRRRALLRGPALCRPGLPRRFGGSRIRRRSRIGLGACVGLGARIGLGVRGFGAVVGVALGADIVARVLLRRGIAARLRVFTPAFAVAVRSRCWALPCVCAGCLALLRPPAVPRAFCPPCAKDDEFSR
jgi:hypothetical protein